MAPATTRSPTAVATNRMVSSHLYCVAKAEILICKTIIEDAMTQVSRIAKINQQAIGTSHDFDMILILYAKNPYERYYLW